MTVTTQIAAGVLAARAADVMITRPKTLPAGVDVAAVREQLRDDHVHLLLLVTPDGRLRGTVARGDLPDEATGPALAFASLAGRTVAPDDVMADVHPQLLARGLRRLAVVAADGRLLGLLCLKRSGTGYCTDDGVAARAAEQHLDVSPC